MYGDRSRPYGAQKQLGGRACGRRGKGGGVSRTACGREDARPVHRLLDEDCAELQEGRCGAVRPDQRNCRPGPDGVVLTCVHPAGGNDGGGDDRVWSAFASTSEAERLQAWRCIRTLGCSCWQRYCRSEEGGRRRGEGSRPRGQEGWEGGRAPPARHAGGAQDSGLQGPVPGVPHPPAFQRRGRAGGGP